MKRERWFVAGVKVTGELLEGSAIPVEPLIRRWAEKALSELRGPRGGRYVPFGDIEYLGSTVTADDFIRGGVVTFRARRWGRYVRPAR